MYLAIVLTSHLGLYPTNWLKGILKLMYQSTLISVLLLGNFGGIAVGGVGFGDATQYFRRVWSATVNLAFLRGWCLQSRLATLLFCSRWTCRAPQAFELSPRSQEKLLFAFRQLACSLFFRYMMAQLTTPNVYLDGSLIAIYCLFYVNNKWNVGA